MSIVRTVYPSTTAQKHAVYPSSTAHYTYRKSLNNCPIYVMYIPQKRSHILYSIYLKKYPLYVLYITQQLPTARAVNPSQNAKLHKG
jgi:hypothetical protein